MGSKLKFGSVKLTPGQEMFCQLFSTDKEFFGNGTQSYIEAFDVDTNKSGAYKVAAVMAHKLLKKANIYTRISELLEDGGLNDANVDKQLSMVVTQSADLGAKIQAIREYNKLKGRIVERSEIKSEGGGITINVVKKYEKSADVEAETVENKQIENNSQLFENTSNS